MTIDKNNPKHLIADEGKVLKRTIGFPLRAKEIFLGEVKVNGQMEADKKENYIEIDEQSTRPKRRKEEQE